MSECLSSLLVAGQKNGVFKHLVREEIGMEI
jgi:hypothetical protein